MKRVNTCPACNQKIPEEQVIVNATFDPSKMKKNDEEEKRNK